MRHDLDLPEEGKGYTQWALQGTSFLKSFDEAKAPSKETQYYVMLGSRGIWHKGWKANTVHASAPGDALTRFQITAAKDTGIATLFASRASPQERRGASTTPVCSSRLALQLPLLVAGIDPCGVAARPRPAPE